MKIFRLENKYNFGPFIGGAVDGDQFLQRDDVDYEFPREHCPPSNHHVFGFEYLSMLSSAFKNNFDILDSNLYQIAEYEVADFVNVDGNVFCFDLTKAEFIRRIDVYGHPVDHVQNLDEFISYSYFLAVDAEIGFSHILCDGYVIHSVDGSERIFSRRK